MSAPRLPRVADMYEAVQDPANPCGYGWHEIARDRAAGIAGGWKPADLVAVLGEENPEVRLVAAVLLTERSLADPSRRCLAIEALTPLIPVIQPVPLPDGSHEGFFWKNAVLDLGGEVRALVERLAAGIPLSSTLWRALIEAWLVADEIPPAIAQAFHRQEPDLTFAMLSARAFEAPTLPPERRTRALRALFAHSPGPSVTEGRAAPRHELRGERLSRARGEVLAAVQAPATPPELRFGWAIEWGIHDPARFRHYREAVQRGTIDQARRYLIPYVRHDRLHAWDRPLSSSNPEATPPRWLADGLAIVETGSRVREILLSFSSLLGGFLGLRDFPSHEAIAEIRAAFLERPDSWARLLGEAERPHPPSLGLATLAVALRAPELTRRIEETVRLRRAWCSSPSEPEASGYEDLEYALRWIRQDSPPP